MDRGEILQLPDDPYEAFALWFTEADRLLDQAEAVALATADGHGTPSARIVLHKGIVDGSFTFYTNYESRKGAELDDNAAAALLFFWQPLKRQIRIEGRAQRLTRRQSQTYFATRDRESQVGAWASQQSRPLSSRDDLMAGVEDFRRRFAGEEVPCPEHWGGFALSPTSFEFWQGRENRLHERQLYEREGRGWRRSLLAP